MYINKLALLLTSVSNVIDALKSFKILIKFCLYPVIKE